MELSEKEKQAIEWFKECLLKENFFEEDMSFHQLQILLNLIEKLQKENDRLSELTMFALLPPNLYNRELSTIVKEAFKKIVKENLNEDTHGIRRKIVDWWNKDY